MELRLLSDYRGRSMTLFDLGYLDEQIKLIKRMTQRTVGVNIFSGPTGSGKSTTLECLLSMLLKEYEYKIHLLTIEDPPEYEIEGSVQTPIICDHSDPVALSREWVSAISNAMRLDPDVMMVGEIRDFDSAVAAFCAAMTGHGLWTTLHANDAISILARLQDIGVQMSLLTDAALVTGLINQSLVPVLCPHCKLPFHEAITKDLLPTDTIERVVQYCDPEKVFIKGPGCKQGGCQEGISGRTVIAEVIGTTQKFMSIFREEGNAASRNYWVNDLGGITKNQHLIRRLNEGIIDPLLAERRVCSLDYDHFTLG
jgi:type II secretory ATPase GspE/PulE/Tfp pilus assembly ATPase PilB-like protein